MSMFSSGRSPIDLKNFKNVKSFVEHISLYVGLVVYTAAGAKVGSIANKIELCDIWFIHDSV